MSAESVLESSSASARSSTAPKRHNINNKTPSALNPIACKNQRKFTKEEHESIWRFLLGEVRRKEPERAGRVRSGEVDPRCLNLWQHYKETFYNSRPVDTLRYFYRYHHKELYKQPFLTKEELLDLYFGLAIPVHESIRLIFIEEFGAAINQTGIITSATGVDHWEYESDPIFKVTETPEEDIVFSPEDDWNFWLFVHRKITNKKGKVKKLGPLAIDKIWKEYSMRTETKISANSISNYFKHKIMSADLNMQIKIEIMFGMSHPIDETTLKIIEQHAKIELNSRREIQSAVNGTLHLEQTVLEHLREEKERSERSGKRSGNQPPLVVRQYVRYQKEEPPTKKMKERHEDNNHSMSVPNDSSSLLPSPGGPGEASNARNGILEHVEENRDAETRPPGDSTREEAVQRRHPSPASVARVRPEEENDNGRMIGPATANHQPEGNLPVEPVAVGPKRFKKVIKKKVIKKKKQAKKKKPFRKWRPDTPHPEGFHRV